MRKNEIVATLFLRSRLIPSFKNDDGGLDSIRYSLSFSVAGANLSILIRTVNFFSDISEYTSLFKIDSRVSDFIENITEEVHHNNEQRKNDGCAHN